MEKEPAAAFRSRRKKLPAEFVNGFAVVFFACLGERLGPFGVVYGVGIELGLQCDTGALAVMDTALTGFIQVIAGIELDTGAIRVDGHGAAGVRVTQNGTGGTENLEIVVIAALQLQTLIVFSDVPANGPPSGSGPGGLRSRAARSR